MVPLLNLQFWYIHSLVEKVLLPYAVTLKTDLNNFLNNEYFKDKTHNWSRLLILEVLI